MASESRLRCGFGHSVATTKAMNVFWMILHTVLNLTPRSVQASRRPLYEVVHSLPCARCTVRAGGRAAPEEVGEAMAPHQDPLTVCASLEHVPGSQCVPAHG